MTTSAHDLFDELHRSAGMVFFNREKGRAFSYHIFRGNLEELKKACLIVENPEVGVKLMSQAHRSEGWQAHMEVNRLLHNCLASAQTLVEHTRVFVRQYYDATPVKQAYEQKVQDEFSLSGISKFVQDLRNYMLHKGLPNSQMSLEIKRTGDGDTHDISTTVALDRDALLQWSKWSSLARSFLTKCEKQVKVSMVASDYGDKVISFYEWFDAKLRKYHEADIKAFEELQRRYHLLRGQEDKANQSRREIAQ